uniref:Nuclear receptor domain-containing protein n=1 Tax=Globodera rostochiensis TaxID=31243 RepID=A0A914HKF2_GLORO
MDQQQLPDPSPDSAGRAADECRVCGAGGAARHYGSVCCSGCKVQGFHKSNVKIKDIVTRNKNGGSLHRQMGQMLCTGRTRRRCLLPRSRSTKNDRLYMHPPPPPFQHLFMQAPPTGWQQHRFHMPPPPVAFHPVHIPPPRLPVFLQNHKFLLNA